MRKWRLRQATASPSLALSPLHHSLNVKSSKKGQEGRVTAWLLQGTPNPSPFHSPSVVLALAQCMATEWTMLGTRWPSTDTQKGACLPSTSSRGTRSQGRRTLMFEARWPVPHLP